MSPRVTHLRERLTALYQRLFDAGDRPEERSARSVRAIRQQAAGIEDRIAHLLRDDRLLDRQTRSLQTVEAPTLAEVQRDLEPGVALIEFFLASDRLFTFFVTQDEVRVVSRPATEHELHHLLLRFHFHLSKFQRTEPVSEDAVLHATRKNLTKLADIVLAPIAEHLTAKRLVIIPHGVLHHLPVHALPWGDGWVADEFEVIYAPSAAVYAHCGETRPSADGGACVFGLPDELAPQIEDEAHRVAAVLESDHVYLREHATFERLRTEVQEARFVHIATHGMFRPDQPMLSSIRLADKWVNLYDLYDLDVRGELVVLSTCESGTADVTRGDEILGLTRGFLYAGAPALLTSQWRVHDAVTTELMASFYRHLRAQGDAAAALRAAMADIRREHPHPYYWAPFFLTGRPVAGGHAERVNAPASAGEQAFNENAHSARAATGERHAVLQ